MTEPRRPSRRGGRGPRTPRPEAEPNNDLNPYREEGGGDGGGASDSGPPPIESSREADPPRSEAPPTTDRSFTSNTEGDRAPGSDASPPMPQRDNGTGDSGSGIVDQSGGSGSDQSFAQSNGM